MTSLSSESRNKILRKKISVKKKIILIKTKFHKYILGRKKCSKGKEKKYSVKYFKQEGFKLSVKSYP